MSGEALNSVALPMAFVLAGGGIALAGYALRQGVQMARDERERRRRGQPIVLKVHRSGTGKKRGEQ